MKHALLSMSDDEIRKRLSQLRPEETKPEDFAQLVCELRQSALPVYAALAHFSSVTIDCCGTGGSGIARFNTSTASAFVLAAAGLKVAKFGNRAASSASGSFDFLDAIGFPGWVDASRSAFLLHEYGLCFLYAPNVYPALAKLSPIRKALGHATVLNFAGPLLNPCRPKLRFMGVADRHMQKLVAACLHKDQQGCIAAIVRSPCGLDEVCPLCGAEAIVLDDRQTGSVFHDEDFQQLSGYCSRNAPMCAKAHAISSNESFSPEQNARRFFSIIDGSDTTSPAYQILVVNSALALRLSNRDISVPDACRDVADLIASGAVQEKYLQLRDLHESYTR